MIAEVILRVYFDNIKDVKKIESFRKKNPEWSEVVTTVFTKFETVKYLNNVEEDLDDN